MFQDEDGEDDYDEFERKKIKLRKKKGFFFEGLQRFYSSDRCVDALFFGYICCETRIMFVLMQLNWEWLMGRIRLKEQGTDILHRYSENPKRTVCVMQMMVVKR